MQIRNTSATVNFFVPGEGAAGLWTLCHPFQGHFPEQNTVMESRCSYLTVRHTTNVWHNYVVKRYILNGTRHITVQSQNSTCHEAYFHLTKPSQNDVVEIVQKSYVVCSILKPRIETKLVNFNFVEIFLLKIFFLSSKIATKWKKSIA
jgi:nicotinic acid phosphoribosyltransferase